MLALDADERVGTEDLAAADRAYEEARRSGDDAAADEAGAAMVFTGQRHFRH